MTNLKRDEILLLFDVDGTLTGPRMRITPEMEDFLYLKVLPKATLGVVSGSDLEKLFEQISRDRIQELDYVFPENGLVHIERGQEKSRQSLQNHLGEEKIQEFVNFNLQHLSTIKLPLKRGTFIEFRSGMINISPIGRNCTREERNAFAEYDKEHEVRKGMIEVLRKQFPNIDLTYSIGGQISFDVFPKGWDKSYCLNHVTKGRNFKEIHFFGDKTDPGGNDHEIFADSRTVGHSVTSPDDTKRKLQELLGV
ncbi:phosphomannomutase-like [Phlebotomus argentipes]|uniref:phosphomannomutase-like n=1 Tax=Phlebotomus argentipes TaxID=94469 RepID=UPI0028933F45|nr:phosphomannomutase-like [Phlebotomus argentipes]